MMVDFRFYLDHKLHSFKESILSFDIVIFPLFCALQLPLMIVFITGLLEGTLKIIFPTTGVFKRGCLIAK